VPIERASPFLWSGQGQARPSLRSVAHLLVHLTSVGAGIIFTFFGRGMAPIEPSFWSRGLGTLADTPGD
jgi:hypothetical protein